jgi:hypothetical protein
MKELYFGQGRIVICSFINGINIKDIKFKIENYLKKKVLKL